MTLNLKNEMIKFNTELFNLQKQIDSSESQNLEEEKMRKN